MLITRWKPLHQHPSLYLAIGFLVIILLGTALLASPFSTRSGQMPSIVDAFFTATSATCVTGLVVFPTAGYWSIFGQVVILCLIQIGGLGFMAMTVLIAMLLHRKITLSDRLIIKEQFGQRSLTGMVRWMLYIIGVTFLIEAAGAVLLSTQLIPRYGWGQGIWFSVFHAVSAFCNAGFDLFGTSSLQPFENNHVMLLTVSFLIVSGGLGFGVYLDVFNRKTRRVSLHTKLVLAVSGLLLLSGALLFYFIENGNPETLGHLSQGSRWLGAFFQSVTTRTAGFFSFSQSGMYEISAVLSILLMFVGGSPAGTAGGIKTTTVAVLFLSMRAQLRGDEQIAVFGHGIAADVVMRALTIIMLGLLWVTGVSFVIAAGENISYVPALFETVSAFGTVGLTMDLTPELGTCSKILLAFTMYAGRVGPVTLALALVKKKNPGAHAHAEGNVMVG